MAMQMNMERLQEIRYKRVSSNKQINSSFKTQRKIQLNCKMQSAVIQVMHITLSGFKRAGHQGMSRIDISLRNLVAVAQSWFSLAWLKMKQIDTNQLPIYVDVAGQIV